MTQYILVTIPMMTVCNVRAISLKSKFCLLGLSYLSTASAVMLSADDSERSLAGNAGVAGFIRYPVWWICTEPMRNSYQHVNLSPAVSTFTAEKRQQANISTKPREGCV